MAATGQRKTARALSSTKPGLQRQTLALFDELILELQRDKRCVNLCELRLE
jgi:hypothetical protein